uniref:cDNA FLJ43696 fis, clone TBAES2007964 n=1 Tax=Homo sapiens TaxID=9606 RepID=Q6ZUH9_HUMAN|nr:unnamed protein product [Homo sapiens]
MQPVISALNIQTQTVQTHPAPRNTSEHCTLPACDAQEEHRDTVDGSIARTESASGEIWRQTHMDGEHHVNTKAEISVMSANQGAPRITSKPPEARREARDRSLPSAFSLRGLTDTLILGFCPPEL